MNLIFVGDKSTEPTAPSLFLQPVFEVHSKIESKKYGWNGHAKIGTNGSIVISDQNAVMIDLPWTDKQTGILFDWIKEQHNVTIDTVVPTHSHTDCAGGLKEAHR